MEKASWIAAIVSAFVAIITLYFTVFQPTQTQNNTALTNISSPTQIAIPTETNARQEQDKLIQDSSDKPTSIAVSLSAAKKISNINDRDIELDRLAHIAIKRHEFQAALDTAKSILNIMRKDQLLELINCYAAYYGNFEIANEAANNASSTKSKTNMLLKISRTSSLRSGEGDNSSDCKDF
ncbi:hypothetical protein [Sulfurospirillum arsenophilum]|uniref:hypothetical protein n=1 Tax=Sulfurospirillum arsenophilum TaxID=56698 RepID=UPI0005AB3F3D|nr:hypothetical protein [Sulfurospirillum arsenophilum]